MAIGSVESIIPEDFDSFYTRRRDHIGRALSLTLNDLELGFEAADEAMARACQRWDEVGTYANPDGWVYRVGLNWARSSIRRLVRFRSRAALVADTVGGGDGSLDVDLDLQAAVDHLPPIHREVVVLRFYFDWTVEQIADALELPRGTVKSRLSRGLDTLRIQLELSNTNEGRSA